MTCIKTAALALLLHVVLFSSSSFAAAIYTPGGPIGDNQFASTGIFTSFVDSSGAAVVNQTVQGLNTQELFLQLIPPDLPNNLRFDGLLTDAPVDVGEPFLLGYLTYTNGLLLIDTYASDVVMQTSRSATSTLPPRYTQTYTDRVFVNVTANTGTDEQNADIVWLENRPELGSFRVYENRAATIELMGVFGSLDIFGFGDVVSPTGSGFYFAELGQVPTGFVPTDTGNGTFIPAPPQVPVPEPASVTLVGSALALTLRRMIRRRVPR